MRCSACFLNFLVFQSAMLYVTLPAQAGLERVLKAVLLGRAYLGRGLLQALALRVSAGLQHLVCAGGAAPAVAPGHHPEAVGVGARSHLRAVPAEAAVELVEDAVVLVQVPQLHSTTEERQSGARRQASNSN